MSTTVEGMHDRQPDAQIEESPPCAVFRVVVPGLIQGQWCREGWYFWDEVGLLGCDTPYPTREAADVGMRHYAASLLHKLP